MLMVRNGILVLLCLPVWADWLPLGPYGGAAAIVQADPHFYGTVISGTRNALLFRSRDGGTSWVPLRFSAQLRAALNALVIAPRTPRVYLAGLSSESPEYSGI